MIKAKQRTGWLAERRQSRRPPYDLVYEYLKYVTGSESPPGGASTYSSGAIQTEKGSGVVFLSEESGAVLLGVGPETRYVTSEVKPIDEPTVVMKAVLGQNGIDRIDRFMEMEDGWDSGRGRAFSKASLGMLDTFLHACDGCPIPDASIFMTANGNLQLEWNDREGNACEIEFFPDRLEYYFEGADEEGKCGLAAVASLVSRIKAEE